MDRGSLLPSVFANQLYQGVAVAISKVWFGAAKRVGF
jgi:hypothetical protein